MHSKFSHSVGITEPTTEPTAEYEMNLLNMYQLSKFSIYLLQYLRSKLRICTIYKKTSSRSASVEVFDEEGVQDYRANYAKLHHVSFSGFFMASNSSLSSALSFFFPLYP
jgi:hypothetical protein